MQGNLNPRRYFDDVLRPHVIPFLHNYGSGVTFQHDNARPHTALITRQFLAKIWLTFFRGLPYLLLNVCVKQGLSFLGQCCLQILPCVFLARRPNSSQTCSHQEI